jgi:GNAT superfamily N-acetyltransferase
MDLPGIILEHVPPEVGCPRAWKAGLFIDDESTSHVLFLVVPEYGPAVVHDVWLAKEVASGRDVGLAISSDSLDVANARELNVYVDAAYQNRGIGSALLAAAMAHTPQAVGNYTLDSVRLYQRAGLRPGNTYPLDQWEREAREYGPAGADARFIQRVLEERDRYDRAMRSSRRTP